MYLSKDGEGTEAAPVSQSYKKNTLIYFGVTEHVQNIAITEEGKTQQKEENLG